MKKTRVWLGMAALLATVLLVGPNWLGCKGGLGPSGQITVQEEIEIPLQEPTGVSGETGTGEVGPDGLTPGEIVPSEEIPPTTEITPVKNMLVVTLDGLGTVTSNPAGINCAGDCDESYDAGTSVELTAVADSTYTFDSWSGACTGSGACIVTMNTNRSVTAKFLPKRTYQLSISMAGSGSVTYEGVTCSPADLTACVHDYYEATPPTEVILTATPESGYTFDGWAVDCSGTGDCRVTMDTDKSVMANFSTGAPPVTENKNLNIKINKGLGDGSVTVTKADGTSLLFTFDDTAVIPTDESVALDAVAIDGTFYQWEVDCTGSATPCSLTMDEDKNVTAVFKGPAPTVITNIPNSDAIGISVKKAAIKAEFSQPMKEGTIDSATFTLTQGNNVNFPADSIVYDDTNKTVTFKPETIMSEDGTNLYPMRVYEAKLTTGIQNIEDTPFAADYIWNFRTVDGKWMPPFALEKSYFTVSYMDLNEVVISGDNRGYFAAIWTQVYDEYSRKGVYINSFKPRQNWAASPAPRLLDSGYVSDPIVSVNKSGNAFISWKKRIGVNSNIYLYKYGPMENRTTDSDPKLLFADPGLNYSDLKEYKLLTECTTFSNALVAWIQHEGGHDVLYAKYIQASDFSMSAPSVLSGSANDASNIQMVSDSAGNIYVAWVEKISGKHNIFVARSSGGVFETPVQMNAAGSEALSPQVSVRTNGELAIAVWMEKAAGSYYKVMSKMYRSGAWDSTPVQIDNGTSDINFASTPKVAMSYDGDAVVAYKLGHAARWGLYARLFDVRRGTWGEHVEIAPEMSFLGNDYKVGMDVKSNVIIVWRQRVSEALEEGGSHYPFDVIYAKRHMYCTLDSCNRDEWDPQVKITRANRSLITDDSVNLLSNLKMAVSEGQGSTLLVWSFWEKYDYEYAPLGFVQTHNLYADQFDLEIAPVLKIDMKVPVMKPIKLPGFTPPTDIITPPGPDM